MSRVSVPEVMDINRETAATHAMYGAAPVYGAPVYVPAPVYVQEPYWYPPVSIGLGFSFGKSWGGHRHHHRGYRRR